MAPISKDEKHGYVEKQFSDPEMEDKNENPFGAFYSGAAGGIRKRPPERRRGFERSQDRLTFS
jgi:hypothetical protein